MLPNTTWVQQSGSVLLCIADSDNATTCPLPPRAQPGDLPCRRRARVEGTHDFSSHAEKAVSAKLVAQLQLAASTWQGASPPVSYPIPLG